MRLTASRMAASTPMQSSPYFAGLLTQSLPCPLWVRSANAVPCTHDTLSYSSTALIRSGKKACATRWPAASPLCMCALKLGFFLRDFICPRNNKSEHLEPFCRRCQGSAGNPSTTCQLVNFREQIEKFVKMVSTFAPATPVLVSRACNLSKGPPADSFSNMRL